jgi:hypothetical protein
MVDQTISLKQLWADVKKTKGAGIDDSMFDMTDDFGTLEKIKDIIEEISMLTQVQNQQNKALKSLESEEVYPLEDQMFDLKSVSRGSHKKDDLPPNVIDPTLHLPDPSKSPSFQSNNSLKALLLTAVNAYLPGDEEQKRQGHHKSPRLLELLRRAEERTTHLASLAQKAKSSYEAVRA